MQADEGHGGGIAAQPTGAIRFITVWPTHLSSKPTDGMTQVCVCVCARARARMRHCMHAVVNRLAPPTPHLHARDHPPHPDVNIAALPIC
jgi:hypothetical protein